jgi:monofunctional biosynthetic peptidoglycan transglycosylase
MSAKYPKTYFTFLIETFWGKRRIMEVYLNVAETGIGTYGAESGAQRYFNKSAANLSRVEAARMAAALPLAQKTRRERRQRLHPPLWQQHFAARINIVKRDGTG